MSLMEIFVHGGCLSEQPAVALAEELRKEFPTWMVQVVDNRDRACTWACWCSRPLS